MLKDVIYILINPAFPHLVKIGYADDVANRIKTLNSNSGIPADFHVYATYEVAARLEDIKLHSIIDSLNPSLRYNKKREFYNITPQKAYALLEAIATINGLQKNLHFNPLNDPYVSDTADSLLSAEKKTAKPPLTFDMINIKAGEELVFTEDNTVKVTVDADLKHVVYNGNKISMSALAQKLLNTRRAVQGTMYFAYKGEKLTEIREKISKDSTAAYHCFGGDCSVSNTQDIQDGFEDE